MPHFKSFLEQALHYFDRPAGGVPGHALTGPDAWRGETVQSDPDWLTVLAPAEIEELLAAQAAAAQTGKALGELDAGDFPLPTLGARIAAWRTVLREGRGFVLLRGFPAKAWSVEEAERAFWCFGHHLGLPGAQNAREELLGHVRNTGAGAADIHVREYQTDWKIGYHCDLADIVGLMCLQPARTGGISRLVSSVAVFNEILDRRPDLVATLFEAFNLDRREEGDSAMPFVPIEPARFDGTRLRTFWHGGYFRSAQRHAGAPAYTPAQQDLLDLYDTIANEPGMAVEMELQAGDVQLVSNHNIVHARTGYQDWPDPGKRRHLLRLWLSLHKN